MKKAKKAKPAPVAADALATHFAECIRAQVGPANFAEVLRRNATPDYYRTECCASHDFCDANVVMLDAYCRLANVREDDVDLDGTADLFSAAWGIAAVKHLGRPAKTGR